MKNYLHYIILSFFLSIPTFAWSDTVPIEGEWTEDDLRSTGSVPFIVEKEGNTLYICSNKRVEDVLIRIVSMEGHVFYENVHIFFANETIVVPLNNLPTGNFAIDFFHESGCLSGEFSNL